MSAFVSVEYVTADGTPINGLDKLVVAREPALDNMSTLYSDSTVTVNMPIEVPTATAAQGVLALRTSMLGDVVFVAVQ